MVNRYRTVERVGFGSRLSNSFVSVLLGIILFLGAFFVLFWNEGRVNLSHVAKTAVAISPTAPATASVGSLVSVTGPVSTPESLGDGVFLRPGPYVALNRRVEMFAWDEKKETRTQENFGGSETRETIYSYTKVWTEKPEDSSQFYRSQDYQNPPMPFQSQLFRVTQASIGNYTLMMNSLSMETPSVVSLNPATVMQGTIAGSYVYQGRGSLNNPEIGDLRVSYTALNNGTPVTVFARLASPTQLDSFLGPRNVPFYRLFATDRNTAIQRLSTEHDTLTWILRIVGFLMMWFGSSMFFEPLNTLLSIFPFLSGLNRFLVGGVTFIVSVVLTGITIVVSMVVHHPLALVISIGVAGFLILRVLRRRPTPDY